MQMLQPRVVSTLAGSVACLPEVQVGAVEDWQAAEEGEAMKRKPPKTKKAVMRLDDWIVKPIIHCPFCGAAFTDPAAKRKRGKR